MKTVNAALKNAIRQDYAVNALPRLTIEWNFNRYVGVTADNTPSESTDGIDLERFPISSLYAQNRPTRGICKGRIGEARVADSSNPFAQDTRFYLSSPDDVYKYWCSPVPTNGSGVFPNHTDAESKVRPAIQYNALISVNKIVINWENSWASPLQYYVYIQTTVGGAWTQLTNNSWTLNSKGQTVIYHQGSDVWTTTRPVDANGAIVTNFKTIAGVKVKVNTMTAGAGANPGTGNNAYCNVIEISARREEDFTNRLISVDDTFDVSDKSNIYPMGTLTTNEATVVLDNRDGVLSKDSSSTYLRWLIEPGAVFNLEYVYTVNGVNYSVQQFKLNGGEWAGQRSENVEIKCSDDSEYLKTQRPRPCLYENLPVTQVMWRLLDAVGYVNYAVQQNDVVTTHKIPYFWADGQKSVWELLDELSRATQTAVYFDAWGVLQMKVREAMYDETRAIDWYLMGQKNSELTIVDGSSIDNQYYVTGGDTYLPDIVNLNQTDTLEANHVTVNYQLTNISDFNNGFPKLDKVWEPDGTVVLRSSNLVANISSTETYAFWINPAEATYWPFSGVVQIEGEFIRYKAKNYIYYNNGVRTGANITSVDEQKKLDAKTWSSQKQLNHYSGAMIIDNTAVAESDPGYPGRGLWTSYRVAHNVDASGYSARGRIGGVVFSAASSFYHDKANSRVVLDASPRYTKWTDLCVVTRGSTGDAGYYYWGTKLKFEPGAGKFTQRAGIVINSNTSENGYYIELVPTNHLSTASRAISNELTFHSRVNDAVQFFGGANGTGAVLPIAEGVWYELDVALAVIGSNHIINIWVNGRSVMTVTVPTGGPWYNIWNGRFGMHFRGQTKVSYEYLYAIGSAEPAYDDTATWYDRVYNGYQGSQWDREWVYGWSTVYRKTKTGTTTARIRNAQRIMDEFGPIVHEVREYNIKFDPAPVMHSNLYFTNDQQIICPEYNSNPFGATFYLANASRENAVVNGEDTLSYVGNSINQILTAYGRVVTQADAAKVVLTNDSQIRRRGKIESEISSQWIQNEATAKDIGAWVVKTWGEGSDEQTVEIFGNPLFELGDVVAISYKDKAMMPAAPMTPNVYGYHQYYVAGISNSFDTGLNTTLTLRRVRPLV